MTSADISGVLQLGDCAANLLLRLWPLKDGPGLITRAAKAFHKPLSKIGTGEKTRWLVLLPTGDGTKTPRTDSSTLRNEELHYLPLFSADRISMHPFWLTFDSPRLEQLWRSDQIPRRRKADENFIFTLFFLLWIPAAQVYRVSNVILIIPLLSSLLTRKLSVFLGSYYCLSHFSLGDADHDKELVRQVGTSCPWTRDNSLLCAHTALAGDVFQAPHLVPHGSKSPQSSAALPLGIEAFSSSSIHF